MIKLKLKMEIYNEIIVREVITNAFIILFLLNLYYLYYIIVIEYCIY